MPSSRPNEPANGPSKHPIHKACQRSIRLDSCARWPLLAVVDGWAQTRAAFIVLYGGGKERRHRPSWLAGIVQRGRRRKEAATASPPQRSWRGVSDRGLSLVRYADGDCDESVSPAELLWLPSPSSTRRCARHR
ncbi:uncharacterized protein C2845_PM16G10260 [Panicum miliaceum]|uniref:Uncharacterized protein n=1 Tax=Panicum miliaceum TaxID=4540 RepID=A0A3L6PVU6_PANMI|nr:uncharacterized protein C2845_PM16G10260 [Panicum miliaceum]